jgi:hypothetical protein
MSLSDWFTAFGFIVAVYALFSTEERRILALKLNKTDPYIFLTALFDTLILIKYNDLYNRFSYLKSFDVSWGINSSNWALILFLSAAIYFAIKLYRIPSKLPSPDLIKYYQTMMKQDFKTFFRLFNKYEKSANNNEHFNTYKLIVFEPAFLEGVSDQPYYYTNLLDKIDKETFTKYFTGLLNNHNSIFYKELSLNADTNLVNEENYFLYKLLHTSPGLFFNIGGLKILRDWHVNYLENEKLKHGQSIYNQNPELVVEDFQLSLPLYLHIVFIRLLYQEAIVQKIDPSALDNGFTNMQSIFSNLIEKIVGCIDVVSYRHHESAEYPLKYHYLISEIFDTVEGWIEWFNEDDNFETDTSLLAFFPSCMRWCLKELLKGFELGVIPEDFVLRIYHYRLMLLYYKHDLKEELIDEIEKVCILEIPPSLLADILTYSLNESFALSFNNFKAGEFRHPGSNPNEMVIIKRLYDLLIENGLFN